MSGETIRLPAPRPESPWTVFLIFLRLGLTAFGGPVAHLAFFRSEFVHKRGWLDDAAYADLVALCQFLPGPASSQVGLALGLARADYAGAAAAWAGFTLPSVLLLIAFALGLAHWGGLSAGLLAGLKIVALAVVAQALWGMAQSLCPDWRRRLLALGAAALALTLPGTWGQLLVLATGALVGLACLSATAPTAAGGLHCPIPTRHGLFWLLLCAALPTPQATPAFAAASVAFLLALLALLRWRLPPWLLVLAGAMSGALLDLATAL